MPYKKQARKAYPEPVYESLLALRLADAGLGFCLALIGFFDLLVAFSLHHGLAGLGLAHGLGFLPLGLALGLGRGEVRLAHLVLRPGAFLHVVECLLQKLDHGDILLKINLVCVLLT